MTILLADRAWPTRLLWLVAFLIAAFCLSVLAVGLALSWPAQAVVGAPPADLPDAQTVAIRSGSGSLLHGWFVPGKRAGGGAVVLMHGVRGNRLSLVERARILHENGFAILLFDFQAHGESTGRHITFGRLEAQDAAAAVAFVRARLPQERIGALGISLGGAAALLGDTPLPVDALVLESVYPDIDAALRNRLRVALGPVIGAVFTPLLAPAFEVMMAPIIGVRPAELRPIDHIGAVTAPVLIVSGTADRHTPLAEAEALYERAPTPKTFWGVPGAAHIDLEEAGPERYWDIVLPFLRGALQRPTAR